MNIKAIMFDMDGVLLDTERLYNKCWRQASHDMGYMLTEKELLSLRSCDIRVAAPLFGGPENYLAVRAHRKELMAELLKETGLPLKPNAAECADSLRNAGLKTAVVTATPLYRAKDYLAQTGLIEHFDTVISAKDVPRGKPFPDVYEFACREFGFAPDECYAVEDSPNGLKSAKSAGLTTIMIPDLTPLDEETRPFTDLCFDNLSEMAAYIINN